MLFAAVGSDTLRGRRTFMSYDVSATQVGDRQSSAAAAARGADVMQVVATSDRAEWESLFASVAFPHLPQSFAYGEAKRAKGWHVTRVKFLEGSRVVAICQLLQLRILGLTLLTRINRGPLFIDAEPAPGTVRAVYALIRRKWGRFYRSLFLMAPALPGGEASHLLLKELGFRLRHDFAWVSGRIDLRQSEDVLWASLASSFRNRLRNAEKAGATLRIGNDAATLDWMIHRHNQNMRDKQFKAVDGKFIRALREAAPEDMLVFQLVVGGEPVAGMSVARFGSRVEYHTGWFGERGREVNAGNFLMWKIITEMKRRGCTEFDVGGLAPNSGYSKFKRTMHPTEFRLAGEWMAF
jgi:CelD/BcsL family acetyltransferase involved in cellulose biosynthesis